MVHRAELVEGDRRDDIEEAFAEGGEEEEGDDDDEAVGEGHQEEFDPEMRQLDGFIRVQKRVEQTGPFVPCVVFGSLPEKIQGEQQEDGDQFEAAEQEAVAFGDIMEDDDAAERCDDGMDEQRIGAFTAHKCRCQKR